MDKGKDEDKPCLPWVGDKPLTAVEDLDSINERIGAPAAIMAGYQQAMGRKPENDRFFGKKK